MPRPRKKTPWDNIILGVYKPPPQRDPCGCDEVCVHGQTCLAGHANYPTWHWYPCDVCTPMQDGLELCRCGDLRYRHTPKCRVASCGCRSFRPKGGDAA